MNDRFTINCLGDVLVGDTIKFTMKHKMKIFQGKTFIEYTNNIEANVIDKYYSSWSKENSFILNIIAKWITTTEGDEKKTFRDAYCKKKVIPERVIYLHDVMRMPWSHESNRDKIRKKLLRKNKKNILNQ
ncbi:MAG: hypothetical protein OXB84_08640, partial [Halobacteriovoraceae bacterium]|nr:hypothetical protein [Halobacteriovoraceae bacterium]